VAKRLAGNLENPVPLTKTPINRIQRRGFDLLKEIGEVVVGSGAGGLKSSVAGNAVVHEIIITDKQRAEKVVIDYLHDRVYRMPTEPRTLTLCLDLLGLMTKDLYGWSPTPLGRD